TFEGWVAPEYLSVTNPMGILSEKCTDSDYSYEFGITKNTDGTGGRLYLDLSDGLVRQSSLQVQPGTWSHVAVTIDNDGTEFWLNGVLAGTAAGGFPAPSNCSLRMKMALLQAGQYIVFPGQLAHVRISNTKRYIESFLPWKNWPADNETVAYWPMGQTPDSHSAYVYDVSGNQHHALVTLPELADLWSFNCPTVCGDGVTEGVEACDGDATCSPTCELTWLSCKALLDSQPTAISGLYWIDPDADGPIEAAHLFCDMQNGGWTLVGNYYDSPSDDMPNETSYVVSGWQQIASGVWDAGATSVNRSSGDVSSSAVSMAFVEALGQSAGQTELTMCFVHKSGYDTSCRSSSDGSLSLVSETTGNPQLTPYAGDALTYTYGRLAGLPGGHDSYDYSQSVSVTYCIPKEPGVTNDGVWGGDAGVQALCDHNCCNAPGVINDNQGVWSAWGSGASYRPNRTNNNEIGNIDGPNPSPDSFGFRLYVSASLCGNDTVDPGEECDDGNDNNDDECSNECVKNTPAAAGVTYVLDGLVTHPILPSQGAQQSFTLVTPNFITSDTDFPANELLECDAGYPEGGCYMIRMQPSAPGAGGNSAWVQIAFLDGKINPNYYFPKSAFTTVGVHTTTTGNQGTLTVTQSP
ncbi:MAG: fibrinogen-like YCDxxxxGGGW domain-containing protein, partial [Myxococcota bacterium]|nr:fibrinogen-like YCDxxxxGGGW domain-containing protein [Myxococcota bacterium]